jgi:hypothetical protein
MSPEEKMAGRTRLPVVLALAAAVGSGCQETTTEPASTLEIHCSANPTSGAAPLTVAFGLDVAGALGAVSVAIQYGDGTQGTDPDARHVYGAGDYMASFTVTAGVESARCSVPVSVAPAPAPAPTPTPRTANQPPNAVFRTTPATSGTSLTGTAPFRVDYNMCTTVDADNDRLLFRMDLDGDGAFEFRGSSGVDCRHSATYALGSRTATLCVADVDCPSWPLCEDYQPLHAFQCRSYTVTAAP